MSTRGVRVSLISNKVTLEIEMFCIQSYVSCKFCKDVIRMNKKLGCEEALSFNLFYQVALACQFTRKVPLFRAVVKFCSTNRVFKKGLMYNLV